MLIYPLEELAQKEERETGASEVRHLLSDAEAVRLYKEEVSGQVYLNYAALISAHGAEAKFSNITAQRIQINEGERPYFIMPVEPNFS